MAECQWNRVKSVLPESSQVNFGGIFMQRYLSLLLSLLLMLSPCISVSATEQAYSDVSDDAWYAEAATALLEMGIMNGVGNNRFDPDGIFTRAQLATVLYRLAGSPAVSGNDSFTDTDPDTWYTDAVLWASQNNIVNGYGDGRFGTNDATTQEQMAVMLWRNAGSYVLGDEYRDLNSVEAEASSWAVDAVRWASVDGLLTDTIPFTPKAAASRAQVADMVYRYVKLLEQFSDVDAVSGATPTEDAGKKTLVAYFSCTGTTETLAKMIADELDAEIFQIIPETPYTAEDLNYSDSSTRATREQNDASARPAISNSVENMSEYDIIYLGYPIWWGQAPKIMYTFVESYDLSGKTLIPFCTSGSSGIGSSATNLSRSTTDATWLDGHRFSAGTSSTAVADWIQSLSY